MKKIKLTQDKYAVVDNADFDYLNQWKWSLLQGKYAHRNAGKKGHIRMHRLIMDAPNDMSVDHINGDGLDNRRSNLRICSHRENLKNMRISRSNRSGYKDIYWDSTRQKFAVQIMSDGKKYYGGRYDAIGEAIQSRNKLILELHKEFANV